MECLYGEGDPRARASAEAHLEVCPKCRARVAQWRAAMGLLDEDRGSLVPRRTRDVPWTSWARPAIAAAVILSLGFVAGRMAGPSRAEMREELAMARTALEADIRARYEADLRQVAVATVTATATENRRWLDQVSAQWAAARLEDRRVVEAALQRFDHIRAADSAAVRAGLFDLVRYTGTGFEQTQSQLNQISQAKWTQPNFQNTPTQ
jgi:anti-sigma factor RsiW